MWWDVRTGRLLWAASQLPDCDEISVCIVQYPPDVFHHSYLTFVAALILCHDALMPTV